MPTHKTLRRLEILTWALIYAGLLTLVLGLATKRADPVLGWQLVAGGGAAALIGLALIVVRARMGRAGAP